MQIGNKLHEQGLIKNTFAYKFYVQFFGKATRINAGEFKLAKNMNVPEIIKTLQGGPLELWVTIPEGLRKEEILEVLRKNLNKKTGDQIVFQTEFLDLTSEKEGYLFPDTYLFPPDVSAQAVVTKLTGTFDQKTEDLKNNIARPWIDIVTMASILERETVTDEERSVVAGILWKRLDTEGWLLQADATVQYAIASVNCRLQTEGCDWWPILTKDDLEINSAYNTYKYATLPPTPIANPGISSIEAATNPSPSSYWFYIHDDNGTIHYAETIEKHNANIIKYLGK